jgi:hypothetical protein
VQLLALVDKEITKDFRDLGRGRRPDDLPEIFNRLQRAD